MKRGAPSVRSKPPALIPFVKLPASQPNIVREYQRQIGKVLRRSQFILGEELSGFEQEFARFCGAKYAVGVANGTEALTIALRLTGIRAGENQQVITTPLTASFTAHAIVAAGARPIFADVDPESLLLDPQSAAQACGAQTAAIIPVHLYGNCCDLPAFRSVAAKARCALIQDAAQAHGATWNGRRLADFPEYVTFSFYPTKNLGALGDAGALVTNSRSIAERARLSRDGGRRGGQVARAEGFNSRLDELQAALLRVHLKHLAAWNRRRRQLAQRYDRLLAPLAPHVELVRPSPPSGSVHHLYVIRTKRRNALRAHLQRRGVETALHYERPLHLHPAFRWLGYKKGDFPNAERAAAEICSLPLHPFLQDAEVDRIAEEIAGFFHG